MRLRDLYALALRRKIDANICRTFGVCPGPVSLPLRARFAIWWHCRVEYSDNKVVAWLGRKGYVLRRYLEGARRPRCGCYEDTAGTYDADGVFIQFGGACPVQGEGTIDGRDCYYRSRGEGWQFHVAPPGSDDVFADDSWVYSERKYIFPDGGWVNAEQSRECIARAVEKFRAEAR